jgi:mannose-6-phosphate isomerase
MQIYKFNTILRPVLWGGSKLLEFKGLPASDQLIGETWELSAMPGRESVVAEGMETGMTLTQLVRHHGVELVGDYVYHRYGNTFPLLIKFIDAHRDLSIQVHPDDKMARQRHGCLGKNEMWYILNSDEHSLIRTGFNRQLTPDEFVSLLKGGSILDVVNSTTSSPGDVFYLRAGQIHSIGAGNFLVEIQESSDITYRVWDYKRFDTDGKQRQLHVQEAREALDFAPGGGKVHDKPCIAPGMTLLVDSPEFVVRHLEFNGDYCLENPGCHTFVAVVCIQGETTLQATGIPPVTMRQGETVLVPAVLDKVEMNGSARLLLATVPSKRL